MANPLISIIVPVYNVEKYLPECIESILSQSYSNFELILVDDGSKDKSGIICDEYAKRDNRIKVYHKQNGGVSSARNLGLDNADGEWITFVDSDDIVEPNYLSSMVLYTENYDFSIIQFSLNRIGWPSSINQEFSNIEKILSMKEYAKSLLNYTVDTGPCARLYRSQILNNLSNSVENQKKIRFNTNLTIGEDLIFNLEYSLKNNSQAILIDKPIYNYRFVENSAMNSKSNLTHKYQSLNIVAKKIIDHNPSFGPLPEINNFCVTNLFNSFYSLSRYPTKEIYEEIRKSIKSTKSTPFPIIQKIYTQATSFGYYLSNLFLSICYFSKKCLIRI